MYSGPLKAPELRTFLDTFALQEPLAAGADAGKGAGVSDPLGHLGQLTVHSLDAGNLTDIDRQDDMWLLGFYAAAGKGDSIGNPDTLVAAPTCVWVGPPVGDGLHHLATRLMPSTSRGLTPWMWMPLSHNMPRGLLGARSHHAAGV